VAGKYFQQGGFSRAIGSEDGVTFSGLKLEIQVSKNPIEPEAFACIF